MPRRNSQNSSKPKRPSPPLTAYNLYFRHERARLLSTGDKLIEDLSPVQISSLDLRDFMAKNPYQSPASRKNRAHSKTHGAISFANLSRTVSGNWKALDEESKEPFREVAHELKVEHYRRIEEERKRVKQNKIIDAICEDPVEATPISVVTPEVQKSSTNPVLVTPPAKKARVGLERVLPLPGPPLVMSPPQMPLDMFSLGASASDMGQSEMPLDDPAIEPIDIRHSAHEGSPILEKDFAAIWLMGASGNGNQN